MLDHVLQADELTFVPTSVLGTHPVQHCLYLSDVDECEDPSVCGTAQCENTEGGYDCVCDIGYIYDNETKSCLGKCVCTHEKTQVQLQEKRVKASFGLSRK